MKNLLTRPLVQAALLATAAGGVVALSSQHNTLEASSHREAPLIADDPLADNTDLYAFRSPDSPNNDGSASVTIIANYIPLELPQGGPNYNTFGENVRYEIHVKNNPATAGDDITYRFTFTRTNEAGTGTFFNIRLGLQNLKTTYIVEKSVAGGAFTNVTVGTGTVPPPNIGPRSINGIAGLNQSNTYATLMANAIMTLADGTKIFCGPTDDPFFADLGGIFDLGGIRAPGAARDGLARKNTHAIALQIPVTVLAKTGTAALTSTTNILDSNYIIGVWASASRPSTRVLSATGAAPTTSGNYVQVSRIGMPLLNEVINPIGAKDAWNSGTPYAEVAATDDYLSNPELGLYLADNVPVAPAAPKPAGQTYYGEAISGPGTPLNALRIQTKSLAGQSLGGLGGASFAGFDFRNGAAGLSGLAGNAALNGTALATTGPAPYGAYLLRAGKPRSVDILPIFHTGVPNYPPYQLATGKNGNPLAAGKPFINNFLLVGGSASNPGGDMLRLNMAVPPTARNSANFSSEGLLAAAVLGLTNATYNTSTAVQNIPNMDGFPNGRRLEDDVTRIELQAVGGVVLAAIGLWYDDYTTTSTTPVTAKLGSVLNFNAGITANDTTFKVAFPFAQTPWSGTTAQRTALAQRSASLGLSPNLTVANAYPNPFADRTTLRFELPAKGTMSVVITDVTGRKVATIAKDKSFGAGANELAWTPGRDVAPGQYIATLYNGSTVVQSVRIERQ